MAPIGDKSSSVPMMGLYNDAYTCVSRPVWIYIVDSTCEIWIKYNDFMNQNNIKIVALK